MCHGKSILALHSGVNPGTAQSLCSVVWCEPRRHQDWAEEEKGAAQDSQVVCKPDTCHHPDLPLEYSLINSNSSNMLLLPALARFPPRHCHKPVSCTCIPSALWSSPLLQFTFQPMRGQPSLAPDSLAHLCPFHYRLWFVQLAPTEDLEAASAISKSKARK